MTTSILDKSAAVAKELRKGSMASKEYSEGPLGNKTMALRIGPITRNHKIKEGIRLWTGTAEFDVLNVNKDNRQAVVAVDEAARSVTRTYDVEFSIRGWNRMSRDQQFRAAASDAFPVTLPGKPRFKLDRDELIDIAGSGSVHYGPPRYKVTATMTVPDTSMTLLLGIDETSHFICALPERASTVGEAHQILRPEGVPAGSLRQGEWFFVPATNDEIDAVYRHIADTTVKPKPNPWTSGPRFTSYSMERGSSHHGLVVTVPELGKFTIGIIKDARAGHHTEMTLPTWHKVVRNTEIVFREPRTPAQRQMARTWD